MHQHQVRLTAQDQLRERAVEAFADGDDRITHLVAVEPR
jgi:hypothetical protein